MARKTKAVCPMQRMRTIDQAMEYIREVDPETALTKNALRCLVVSKAIPSTRIGKKYLLSLEKLNDYLQATDNEPVPGRPAGKIEQIGVIRRIEA